MANRTVSIAFEYVGHDVDLWCLDCNLSTGARLWFTMSTGAETTLRSSAWCLDCKSRRVE